MKRFKVFGSTLVHGLDCPRCFWRRYNRNEKRPYARADETAEIADSVMVDFLRSAEWVDIGCGPGRVHLHSAQKWCQSEPIRFPGDVEIVLAGTYDALIVEDCGTFTLVDNKTSNKDDGRLRVYRRQLAAYTYALEHPDKGGAMQIDETGLWVLSPSGFATKPNRMGLYGPTRWIPFGRDDSAFLKFLGGVADLLAGGEPANDLPCDWCTYRDLARSA